MAVLLDGLLTQVKKTETANWLARLEKLDPAGPRAARPGAGDALSLTDPLTGPRPA